MSTFPTSILSRLPTHTPIQNHAPPPPRPPQLALVLRKRSEARTAQLTRHSGTLAFHYGTDKSHDDHKYTDLYAALLDRRSEGVVNVTEIGVMSGQSMQLWHDYFPKATVWGVDNWIRGAVRPVRDHLRPLSPRVRLLGADSQSARAVGRLGLGLESMDLIIDDGAHKPHANEKTLLGEVALSGRAHRT
ncbi:MAG: hypothetical protein SGPRY_008023 [Prymnesium sp.]